jgi:uncharacterized protein involved in exopolysaccharide biosynthesis
MVETQDRESRRHEIQPRLSSVARAPENGSGLSLLSVAEDVNSSWHDDALARRRHIELARRHAAEPGPAGEVPADEAPTSQPDEANSEPVADPLTAERSGAAEAAVGARFARLLPRWARLRRAPLPTQVGDGPGENEPEPDVLVPAQPERGAAARPAPIVDEPAYEEGVAGQYWTPLIDPMKVLGGVGRSKALILAMALLGAVLGAAIAISTPKKYEATTELIVDPRDLKLTDRGLTDSILASDATLAIVENQMRVLTSGTVLNAVVDRLHLDKDPEFNGSRPAFSVTGFLRSLLPRQSEDIGSAEDRRRVLAVRNLGRALQVERSGKTFVISIGVATENGKKSALIANTMTDVFLQTYGQIQSNTAGRATDELTARLAELRKGVEAAERKVEDFRAAHDLVDAKGQLITDDELLKLNEQLSVARARTMELNAKAASARSVNVDSVLGGGLPEEINSPTMQDLRLQYATLKQQADSAAIKYGPRHPARQVIDAQVAGARERIATELRRIVSSLQTELKRAVQVEQDLASRLAQQKARNGNINDDLVTLRELEREASAKRSVYEAFLLRAKQTDEQKDINTANINVISKAFAPLEAEGPSRATITLAGLLLGLGAGIGLGGVRGAYESLRETAKRRARGEARRPLPYGDEGKTAHRPRTAPTGSEDRATPETAGVHGPRTFPSPPDEPAEEEMSLEEIRASLREFREAVREFSESRSGRRYF